MILQAPKGTFDVLPRDAERRRVLESRARKILGSAGYGRIETPAFESTELFVRGVGEATDIVQKEMYTFDDGGGRSLTLRPEGTTRLPGVRRARHAQAAAACEALVPVEFFRAEAPQRGRYRQFWQVGAEVIGAEGPETDAEVIVLLAELLEAMGVKGARLRIASLGSPETRVEYRLLAWAAYLHARRSEPGRRRCARAST